VTAVIQRIGDRIESTVRGHQNRHVVAAAAEIGVFTALVEMPTKFSPYTSAATVSDRSWKTLSDNFQRRCALA
jgi:hypothetical protein